MSNTRYVLNKILPTMFALRSDGQLVSVMTSNVDDLLYGSLPGHEKAMKEILDTFSVMMLLLNSVERKSSSLMT